MRKDFERFWDNYQGQINLVFSSQRVRYVCKRVAYAAWIASERATKERLKSCSDKDTDCIKGVATLTEALVDAVNKSAQEN